MGCSDCLQELREEFRLRNFGTGHDDPSLFVRPQCLKPVFYVPFTVFWFLFFVSITVLEIVYNYDSGPHYFAFLTNVTFIIQKVAVTFDFVITLYVHIRRKDIRDGSHEEAPWYIQMLWVFYNVVNTASLAVTVLYHSFVEPKFTHGSINLHIINSVYTMVLLLFSGKPVRILHCYQPMIYAAAYTVFSLIYNLAGHDPVYGLGGPLDWENKTIRTVWLSIVIVCVIVPAFHLFCFIVYKLRVLVSRKCTCNGKVSPMEGTKA